jgi:hypothetical protein
MKIKQVIDNLEAGNYNNKNKTHDLLSVVFVSSSILQSINSQI